MKSFFIISFIILNITKHFQVPKHVVLTTQQKEELLKKNMISEKQLPVILKTDPVAKYLGLNPGQAVMVERVSEVGGKYLNFRICK